MFEYKDNTITTDRLVIRRFRMSDAPRVAEICNDFDVYKTTLALPHPYTLEKAESWISRHDEDFATERFFDFAITDRATGELYGCIGLGPDMKNRNGELGYWIAKEHWNKGYATEAARAVIRFAFQVKGLHRVYARHFASNPASGRVMAKSGMGYEGTQIAQVYKLDRYEDIVLYGIVNHEG